MRPFQPEEAEAGLDQRLREAGRTLSPEQRAAALRALSTNRLPGYVRLVSEVVCRWKSSTPAVELPTTAEAIVRSEFVRLARDENQGAVLASRTLPCLAASRNGLAEDDLLDLLSTLDVLADFARRSPNSPPVRSLPPVVWARLHADLAPYVDEHFAD